MSNWWGKATGTPEAAFTTGFKQIPEGTFALSELTKAELFESDGRDPVYSLTWKIADGEYKNRLVFQKIKAFDADELKAGMAKEMLLLLFHMFKVTEPKEAPTDSDFYPMLGKLAMLKIGAWKMDGKEGNFVREVHAAEMPGQPHSALNNLDRVGKSVVGLDDVPF